MVFEQLKQKKYPSNSKFDEIYPKLYQEHLLNKKQSVRERKLHLKC